VAGAPVIYFARDSGALLPLLAQTGADVISLDWRVPLDEARARRGASVAIRVLQGTPVDTVRRVVEHVHTRTTADK